MHKGRRGLVTVILAVVSLLSWLRAVGSVLDREVTFDIRSQPLDVALLEFSRQANVRIMMSGGVVSGEAQRLNGVYSVERALLRLLSP